MIVFDNLLSDSQFDDFNKTFAPISTGHWIGANDEPTDKMAAYGKLLWKHYIAANPVPNLMGYEYWTKTLSNTVPLDWHYDKDETLWENTGEISRPLFGAVLYGEGEVYGGYLEIKQHDGEIERIQYKPNRAIFFDAGNLEHRVSPVNNGSRRTLACNIWDKELTTWK